ncbi:FecCD family ABC transporter permease [Tritonibacter mobilis]|uniref:FecCD family ABC transporter permease n=1 Tax=Tritonibacter mobilis TaxID=379347 RepID=UPI0014038C76|nr:iron chelate uptake ABC transporter family permease subunit [Tritonibacter mobilis]NHM19981.1 iron chelate uptake ABC transporter family permease subunit [Tritonibacter mobilis]NHM24145.1 iron chelate uptake ABC transporter family permease subunit [Tritonibacter mobilis]
MIYTIRLGSLSVRLARRHLLIGMGLFLALLIAGGMALQLGQFDLGAADLWTAYRGELDKINQMILLDHRLPRVLVAIGAGAAFGVSGAIFQSMLRNPMASPDVIGFNAGASCAAVLAILVFGSARFVLPWALTGGLLTAALVLLLAWDRNGKSGIDPYRLILVGIGASLTLGATSDLLMSMTDEQRAADMAQWLTGTLNARNQADAALIWGGLAALTPVLIWLQFPLNRLIMSDDIVHGFGLRLAGLRLLITGVGVLLAALAVSVAGPLPFVAFVAGPVARRVLKTGAPVLFAAALVGALVTLGADTAARMLPVVQLPAGVFTAVIGAPVLMWLLVAQFRKGAL